jgi:hypothetical protein
MGAIAEPAMAAAPAAAEAMLAGGQIQQLRTVRGTLFFLHGSGLRLPSQCVGKVLTEADPDRRGRLCRPSAASVEGSRRNGPVSLARLLLLASLLVASALPGGSRAEPPTPATVRSIGDGDTLRVKQGGRTITVRLACIDAPEMAQRPHGPRAREYLQLRLRPDRTVRLDV